MFINCCAIFNNQEFFSTYLTCFDSNLFFRVRESIKLGIINPSDSKLIFEITFGMMAGCLERPGNFGGQTG